MMRKTLLWISTNPWLAERLPRYGFVRRAVRRFMPGETLDDGLRAARKMEGEGAVGSLLTLLGENVETAEEAEAVADHYLEVLDRGREAGLDLEVSVKLTQLGLDRSLDAARENLLRVVEKAETMGSMVWIDMEDSSYVDRTLEIFRAARERYDGVGICLQAYLRRTDDDLDALLPLKPSIRVVKGAYLEPPDVAYPEKREVDGAFLRITTRLLRAAAVGDVGRVAVGTHDPRMIREAQSRAHELGLGPEAWEVEMLYGIGTAEQRRLMHGRTPLRVLISYGDAWFPWYMRRLAERPANVWFVLKSLVSR